MFTLRHSRRRSPRLRLVAFGVAPLLVLSSTSCATLGKREQGAMIGGAAGGVAGGVVGTRTGSTARGAIIGATAADNLTSLAASLNRYPNTDLLIVGHTDAVGTSDYNRDLSQRRAKSAADYLVKQGVQASRLRSVGRGETEPVADNETEGGRQLNRRVEIAIVANASTRQK